MQTACTLASCRVSLLFSFCLLLCISSVGLRLAASQAQLELEHTTFICRFETRFSSAIGCLSGGCWVKAGRQDGQLLTGLKRQPSGQPETSPTVGPCWLWAFCLCFGGGEQRTARKQHTHQHSIFLHTHLSAGRPQNAACFLRREHARTVQAFPANLDGFWLQQQLPKPASSDRHRLLRGYGLLLDL